VMHRCLCKTVLISLLCVGSAHAADDVVFRTSVTPEDAWVGQQVLLHVDVLAKDGWAQLKKVTEVEVQGAYMLRLESQGTRLSETIDGDSYAGQRYEFMLFTQRGGDFVVPPMPVDVEVRQYGTSEGPKAFRETLPPIEFTARVPPSAAGIRGLISTTDLTATQDWSSDVANAIVGDSLVRVVTLRARNVSAMAFTPLSHPEIESVAIYPEQATVDDKFDRGDLTGTRVETVTYVFERTGDVEIPGIAMSWWDIQTEQLHRIDLPGLSLQVAANPALQAADDAENTPQASTPRWWPFVVALAMVAGLAFRFGGRLSQHWVSWRRLRSGSEPVYFRKLMRSARSGDRRAFLRDTMRWLDRINPTSKPARLDEFVRDYGDSQTEQAASCFMKDLENSEDRSTVRQLAKGLKASRERWLRSLKAGQESGNHLPNLNG
jgi:hypothetical protein